jgi:type III secretion system YscQ/HrcQ family protein
MIPEYAPMAFPSVSRAEADLGNRLYGASGRVRIEIGGKRFRVAFVPAFRAPYRPALRAALAIGERPAVLDMETVPLPELLGYPEGGLDPRDIPPPVLRAYLDGVLGGLRERAGARLGRDIVLTEAGPWEEPTEAEAAGPVLYLEVTPEAAALGGASEPLRARLSLAQEDLMALAEALPQARPAGEERSELPVALHYRVGSACLKAAECAGLGLGDIILLDGDPIAKGGIRLCAGEEGRPLWKTTWHEGKITLEEECEEEMPLVNDEAQGSGSGRLDALEVKLTFDLGGRMAPLSEILALAAGSVLELPDNPDARVSIRAGGKAIGTGTLIMVDGRAGVRVESLREGAQP